MTAEPLRETWTTRELPILAAILRELDEGGRPVSLEQIRTVIGLSVEEMRLGIDALAHADPPYLEVSLTMAGPERVGGHARRVSERARRELGTWPTAESVVDRLVAALEAAAAASAEPEQTTRLRSLADGLGTFGRDVVVEVAASYVPRALGLL